MKNYECPECGKGKDAEDWQYCSNGHKEVGMYEVLHWDNETRQNGLRS